MGNQTACLHVPPPALQNGLCCGELKRLECSGNLSLVFMLGVGAPDESRLLPMEFTSLPHRLLDVKETVSISGEVPRTDKQVVGC